MKSGYGDAASDYYEGEYKEARGLLASRGGIENVHGSVASKEDEEGH